MKYSMSLFIEVINCYDKDKKNKQDCGVDESMKHSKGLSIRLYVTIVPSCFVKDKKVSRKLKR